MSKSLMVLLHDSEVGEFTQDKHGRVSFVYGAEWLNSQFAVPLSHSLPLRAEPFEGKDCQGFFAGVLPEEHNREIIAGIFGVSSRNDFALLEQIGGECAGAVSFLPAGKKPFLDKVSYQFLEDKELAGILRELPKRPLMAGAKDIRLSLAGAQSKLAVHIDEEGISIPLQTAPSTHILKPAISRFEGVVQNELFCMRLGGQMGLSVPRVSSGSSEGVEYLLVERYDRYRSDSGQLERLHQEDFCQALGLPPHMKYQNEGGPSLGRCFGLLRDVSVVPAPDILRLLDAVIFNFLIGNNDAHGKNFSFLYGTRKTGASGVLAPFYDLISTSLYPDLSPKMAMKIGRKYLPDEVRLKDWEEFWDSAGFPKKAAQRRTLQFVERSLKALTEWPIANDVEEVIVRQSGARARRLKEVFERAK